MKQRIACLIVTALVFLSASGCGSPSRPAAASADPTDAPETTDAEAYEEAEQVSVYRQQARGLYAKQQVQTVEGLQVVSGKVVRVGGGIDYTPASGSGFFTINGKLADNNEIAFSINPVSVLRYTLSVQADTDRTVKAEIRAYKQNTMLAAYEQEALHLQAGENTVDACIDTGENRPCQGLYSLRFYIDGCLVAETEYES